jgi:hypothetical protein
MNSREKGKRGERAWRDELRANGYEARRGQQFSGSPDSPDVICEALPWAHFEVKAVERLNIEDAMEEARRDADRGQKSEDGSQRSAGKVPFVAHKRSFRPWLVTMTAETFFRLLRGDFEPRRHEGHQEDQSLVTSTATKDGAQGLRCPTSTDFPAAACAAATSTNNKPTNTNETESQ